MWALFGFLRASECPKACLARDLGVRPGALGVLGGPGARLARNLGLTIVCIIKQVCNCEVHFLEGKHLEKSSCCGFDSHPTELGLPLQLQASTVILLRLLLPLLLLLLLLTTTSTTTTIITNYYML